MEPKRAGAAARRQAEVEELEQPAGPRVEVDELESDPSIRLPVPEPVPEPAARLEYETDRAPAGKPAPKVDWLGVGALTGGLGVGAFGILIAMVGLSLCLDRWSPDWGDGLAMIGVGTLLGVLPGLVASGLGIRRILDHILLRRAVAVARGNDSVDVATLGRLLGVDTKKARKLAMDALDRGLLDARFDVNADRLILRPKASPFR